MVERDAQPGSAVRSTARKCLDNTRSMIQACANMIATDVEVKANDHMRNGVVNGDRRHSSEEPQNQPQKKKAKRTKADPVDAPSLTATANVPPVTDMSGLFTIDPNPTPISTLLSDFEKATKSRKGKRKRSEQEIGKEAHARGTDGPATKRVKKKHEKTAQPATEDAEADHRSFEAKVELRLKQKELDRQMKANKKRKRESDGTQQPETRPGKSGSLAKQESDLKGESEVSAQQATGAATDGGRQANTKRAKRAAAWAARSGDQEDLAAAAGHETGKKGSEVITLDDEGSDYGKPGDQTSKKKKKHKNKPKKIEG